MSTSKSQKKKIKTDLPHGWIKAVSKKNPDKHYYYNTITKQSTWTHPCEGHNSFVREESTTSKKRKSITKKQSSIYVEPNSDIEDYDDTQDDYFDNAVTNPSGLPKKSMLNSSNRPEFSTSKKKMCSQAASSTNVDKGAPNICSEKKSIRSIKLGNSNALSLIRKNYMPEVNLSKNLKTTIPTAENNLDKARKKKAKLKKKKSKKNNQQQSSSQPHVPVNIITNKQNHNKQISKEENTSTEKEIRLKTNNVPTKDLDFADDSNFCCTASINTTQNKNKDVEEMDWEPYDEELMAKNINEFCLSMDCSKTNPNSNYNEINSRNLLLHQSNSGILVLDTNILISCLHFVKEIVNTNIQSFPIIYIPWRVLQELDHLKHYKTKSGDKQLHVNARQATSYLNETFKSCHPRFFGQSFDDYSRIMVKDSSVADDEILQTCLQLISTQINRKVILITNDKNLESKACISNIEAYSKEGFQNKYLTSAREKNASFNVINSPEEKAEEAKINSAISELTNNFRDILSFILETEMKLAFDNDWIKICYKKPPWILKDVLDCLKKHWRSVFFLVFSKEVLHNIEDLSLELNMTKASQSSLNSLKTAAQKLLSNIKTSPKKERPYDKAIDVALSKLSAKSEEFNSVTSWQVDNSVSKLAQPEFPSFAMEAAQQNLLRVQEVFQQESECEAFTDIKNLFRCIWDSIKDFCDKLTNVIHSPGINNNLCLPETRLSLMHRYNDIIQLITLIEHVLELTGEDINETNPVINNLSSFLIDSMPMMDAKLKIKLTKCLVVFFSNEEGRLLLSRSLNDFRQFSLTLLNANEFIERTFNIT